MEQENATEQQPAATPDLASLLAQIPGAPDAAALEKWKQVHGEIFCSGFSDDEIFIWKPVNRREYLEIQKAVQANQEADFSELVVRKCILWSSSERALELKAGSIPTLSEQIMQNSNFMPVQLAANLVIKL